MKALITGSSGTVGTALRRYLESCGHHVVGWDRRYVPTDHYAAMEAYVRGVAPDVLFHLATASQPTGRPGNEGWHVNFEWSSELAWICRQLDVEFLFTSTVAIFSDAARGPFTLASQPDAMTGYAYEKRKAEERVLSQNPKSRIVRLGWQIGDRPGTNSMFDFIHRKIREEGCLHASTRWLPACSFLDDTAEAFLRVTTLPPGIYLADSNRGWSFYAIATAVAALHHADWPIAPTEDFVYDQRMIDPRLELPSLDTRLPALAHR